MTYLLSKCRMSEMLCSRIEITGIIILILLLIIMIIIIKIMIIIIMIIIIIIMILSFDISPFPYKHAQRRITFHCQRIDVDIHIVN